MQICSFKPPCFSFCKPQHLKCPQKSKVNVRSNNQKNFHAKIWWVWPCFYIFLVCCFFPMKTHLITGCHQLDSHYPVFCDVVSNVFGGFGFVLFVLFFFFLLLFCFLFSCNSFVLVKSGLWLKTVLWTGIYIFLWAFEVRFVSALRDIVFVPSNSSSTHFLPEPN